MSRRRNSSASARMSGSREKSGTWTRVQRNGPVRQAVDSHPVSPSSEDDERGRVLELVIRVYGPGEYRVDVDGDTASAWCGDRPLYTVQAVDGAPLAALERHLRRRLG